MESLAWASNSPLWTSLQASELPVPTCEDVSLPHQLSQDNNVVIQLENVTNNNNNSNSSGGGNTLVGLATVRKLNAG